MSSVVCFCLCLYTDFLMKPLATEESAGNCPAIYILVSVCVAKFLSDLFSAHACVSP